MVQVSVIIPNYNHAQYLPKRLSSVFGQTFRDFEVIFLDDASTDESRDVFAGYRDLPNVRHIFNPTNSGSPFAQWNRGIAIANGEYIWIAESDDYCDRNFLGALVERLERNPNAGLAYAQSWTVMETDVASGLLDWSRVFPDGARWSTDFSNSGRNEIFGYLAFENTIPNASAVLFRKSVIGSEIRAQETLKLCGDWLFWINILNRSEIEYVSEPLNYYRCKHAASQREAVAGLGTEMMEALEIQKFILSEFNPGPRMVRRMLRHHLWRWSNASLNQGFPKTTDRLICRQFLDLYHRMSGARLQDVGLIKAYGLFVVPIKKNMLYRKTIGAWRSRQFEKRFSQIQPDPVRSDRDG